MITATYEFFAVGRKDHDMSSECRRNRTSKRNAPLKLLIWKGRATVAEKRQG